MYLETLNHSLKFLTVANIPILIADLAFANFQDSCLSEVFPGFRTTIHDWLYLLSYWRLALLLVLPLTFLHHHLHRNYSITTTAQICAIFFYCSFIMKYEIDGAMLYFGPIARDNQCETATIKNYVCARLLLGLLEISALMFICFSVMIAVFSKTKSNSYRNPNEDLTPRE